MQLIGNSLNNEWPANLTSLADNPALTQIDLAVAFVTKMDEVFALATKRGVPMNMYALADGNGFPSIAVVRKFLDSPRAAWRIHLTRAFYHPKIMWFRGIGAYIGSANLTDKAWFQNLECGVWLTQSDLDQLNWNEELTSIFSVIAARCREATADDLAALEELDRRRTTLRAEELSFRKEVDRLLGNVPGDRSPIDPTKPRVQGGAAKAAFTAEWSTGLTILRKITRLFDERKDKWPQWVDRNVPPSIVQDQATEWWWHNEFRRKGESASLMLTAHQQNTANPDAAVDALYNRWSQFTPDPNHDDWTAHVNHNPMVLHSLLTRSALKSLDVATLKTILGYCHSAREHGRQAGQDVTGLMPGDQRTRDERVELFAEFLDRQRTPKGKAVRDVLEYVLWGDQMGLAGAQHAEDRIWTACYDPAWKLPHLATAILGELIGYARPEEYPPRNNRVSKTLFALGFPGIRYN